MPLPTPRELWLLHKWSPLLGYMRRLSETLDARERAVIVGDATEWLSSQVKAPTLGRLSSKLAAVMRTPEGVELVREAVLVGDKLVESMEQAS